MNSVATSIVVVDVLEISGVEMILNTIEVEDRVPKFFIKHLIGELAIHSLVGLIKDCVELGADVSSPGIEDAVHSGVMIGRVTKVDSKAGARLELRNLLSILERGVEDPRRTSPHSSSKERVVIAELEGGEELNRTELGVLARQVVPQEASCCIAKPQWDSLNCSGQCRS